ncbi:MAG: hypothetical protein WBA76_13125 [Phormidesmis sp.]
MTQAEVQWSDAEKEIAKDALKKAHDREVEALIAHVQEKASKVSQPEDVWQLHDFLSARRYNIDGKYDDRDDYLMFTLSTLIKDNLISVSELDGLTTDKRAKINLLIRM